MLRASAKTSGIAIVATVLLLGALARGSEEPERLIVKCARPCAAVALAVQSLGGDVTFTYENVDAMAVSVPQDAVASLSTAFGADAIRKDVVVDRPVPIEPTLGEDAVDTQALDESALATFAADAPANYNYNNALTGAASLHAAGQFGRDVVVAVIDSGVQVAASALGPVGAGTVIGGETFVPLATDPVFSPTSRLNDWHGTTVSSMIAAHAEFVFATSSRLVQSLLVHSPESVRPCPGPPFSAGCPEIASLVPMIGVAPASKIYALKVFPSSGGGAPESRIIAAMDRAITLRRNFDAGVSTAPAGGAGTEENPFRYNALNVQVINMSLGGPTLYAGHDIEDELTREIVDAGIVLTASAGNAGFGAMTVESPGTGLGAITVAAASTPVHERVLRDQSLLGLGVLYRPFSGIQTAYFSSRGPLADGRTGPHLTANGFGSYTNAFAAVSAAGAVVSCGSPLAPSSGSGACASRILFVSGTSFSSPTVAGAAALLRGAVPAAGPKAIRQALIRGANPRLLADRSRPIDQGAGFLDVPNAYARLNSWLPDDDDHGDHDDRCEGGGRHERDDCRGDRHGRRHDGPDDVGDGGSSVIRNVQEAGLHVVQFRGDRFSGSVRRLRPGEVTQFFIPADDSTDRVTVTISDIAREGTPNTLFGDDLFVMGLDAPTSAAVHRIGNGGTFVNQNSTFVIDNPQTGLLRVAIQGDWTNGGVISANVTIERTRNPIHRSTAAGRIEQDDLIPISVTVPAGKAQAVFELFWKQNWGRYPTNDLDMFVFRPNGTQVLVGAAPPGATLNSPERVVVDNPPSGVWTVVINAFQIQDVGRQRHGVTAAHDSFSLRVSADGEALTR